MFMKRKKILSWSLAMAISLLLCGGGIGYAKVTGVCSNCHTMHNSQGGEALDADGPYNYLLEGGCVGCHTGTNESGSTPYVLSTDMPAWNVNTLAGGNFYWVGQGDDAMGHNVLGISSQDVTLSAAPGGNSCFSTGDCHESLASATHNYTDPALVGKVGCEGCHLNVMHHTDDGTGTKYVGASPWYRFLSGHSSADGYGVKGIEDSDWQLSKNANDHNEYLGHVGDKTSQTSLTNYTMTAFCCGCHGNFHVQDGTSTGASPWLRHPSDFVIPVTGEYGFMSTQYNVETPVARSSTTMGNIVGTPAGTGIVAAGTDMVMCLSCHVAHGSPYPDMLRWNYDEMDAGGGSSTKGCFVCHTTKDD